MFEFSFEFLIIFLCQNIVMEDVNITVDHVVETLVDRPVVDRAN